MITNLLSAIILIICILVALKSLRLLIVGDNTAWGPLITSLMVSSFLLIIRPAVSRFENASRMNAEYIALKIKFEEKVITPVQYDSLKKELLEKYN